MPKTYLIVTSSDQHLGSTVALCPPGPITGDDGEQYLPSKAQGWLWGLWTEYTLWADALADQYNVDEVIFVNNGDMVEGDHHNTPQIFSRNPNLQSDLVEIAYNHLFDRINPSHILVIRGTEAHVGKSASKEESIAKGWHMGGRPVIRSEDGHYSHYNFTMDLNGCRLNFTHHGRTGYRPWTDQNAVTLLSWQIFSEYQRDGHDHPNVAIRSHFHRCFDSYDACPTRVLQLPAWQLHTAHTHKVVPESIAHIGGAAVLVREDGTYEVFKFVRKPERGAAWKP